MASKVSIRSFSAITHPARWRAQCVQLVRASPPCISHQLSTSASAAEECWSRTPPAMVAPVRHRAGVPYAVNTNQALLDKMYNLFLGPGGDKWLSIEVKWLAITHKSFDHGRRGFNDRMAFLGKRIVQLHTTLAIINSPSSGIQETPAAASKDTAERTPFIHPAVTGLENLSTTKVDEILDKSRLAQLANRYGLTRVIRWKPKKADNLAGSGIESVVVEALYAIVGAVALSKGGAVAARVVRERILHPLGLVVG